MLLPRISIVTPSFNQASFLEEAMESVLSQGYPSLDYQVLDGGSTDGSAELIRQRAPRLSHWRSGRDAGQSAALREGFARATGDVLGWINSDDALEPGALSAVGEAFARHPEADIVHGDLRFIDRAGRRLFDGHVVLGLGILAYDAPYVGQPAMFWRRSIYEKVGGLDPAYRFAMDFDLVIRMLAAGARGLKLRRGLARFRLHPAAKTSTLQATCDAEVARTLQAHGLAQEAPAVVFAKRWTFRALRFARDPRCVVSAVESRLRTRRDASGFSARR